MRSGCLTFLAVLALPAAALAQSGAAFMPATSGLKPGEKVHVIVNSACAQTECPAEWIEGKVTRLTDVSLGVWDGIRYRELSAADVRRVERPADRIWNGTLIGFSAGFAFGFISVVANPCDPSHWCVLGDGPDTGAAIGLFTGGIGAGIGALTDLLVRRERVVFDRARLPRTIVSPMASRTTAGLRVSVRF